MSIFSIEVIVSMLLILLCPILMKSIAGTCLVSIVWRANIQESFDYRGVSDGEI
jgi:hypothetical protein